MLRPAPRDDLPVPTVFDHTHYPPVGAKHLGDNLVNKPIIYIPKCFALTRCNFPTVQSYDTNGRAIGWGLFGGRSGGDCSAGDRVGTVRRAIGRGPGEAFGY